MPTKNTNNHLVIWLGFMNTNPPKNYNSNKIGINNSRGWLGFRHCSKHFKFNIYWVSRGRTESDPIHLSSSLPFRWRAKKGQEGSMTNIPYIKKNTAHRNKELCGSLQEINKFEGKNTTLKNRMYSIMPFTLFSLKCQLFD